MSKREPTPSQDTAQRMKSLTELWRTRCPNGHSSFTHRPQEEFWYCKSCHDNPDIDTHRHTYLIDTKNGTRITK